MATATGGPTDSMLVGLSSSFLLACLSDLSWHFPLDHSSSRQLASEIEDDSGRLKAYHEHKTEEASHLWPITQHRHRTGATAKPE